MPRDAAIRQPEHGESRPETGQLGVVFYPRLCAVGIVAALLLTAAIGAQALILIFAGHGAAQNERPSAG